MGRQYDQHYGLYGERNYEKWSEDIPTLALLCVK